MKVIPMINLSAGMLVKRGPFQLRKDRIGKIPFEKFLRLYFHHLQQVHDLQYAVRYPTAAGDDYLDRRKPESEINMDQFAETVLAIYSVKVIQPGAPAIGHHTIVSAHHSGEEPKSQDTLAVIMLQAFIVDQRDLFLQYRLKHPSVDGL